MTSNSTSLQKPSWTLTSTRDKKDLTEQIGGKTASQKEEVMRIPLPVTAEIRWTEDLIMQTIMTSKLFREGVRPRYDLGREVEGLVDGKKKEAFYEEFYDMREEGKLTPTALQQLFSKYQGGEAPSG